MKRITLRLDDEVYKKLEKLCKEDDRSINKMVTTLIKKAK